VSGGTPSRPALLTLSLGLLACDAERVAAPEATDAGLADAPSADGGAPLPGLDLPTPQPPALPELPECLQGDHPPGCAELSRLVDWPCPDGWRTEPIFVDAAGNEDTPDGLEANTLCRPPEPASECPDGWMPWLAEGGCLEIGDPCPEGEFPQVPDRVQGPRRYVRPGAKRGDGSPSAPFGSLLEAQDRSPAGSVLVLAAGRYDGPVIVERDLTLWGACASRVEVVGPEPDEDYLLAAVLAVRTARLVVRNLTLTGPWTGAAVRGARAKLTLEGVRVSRATYYGVLADEGKLELVNTLVEDTQPDEDDLYGRGLAVLNGARATVDRTAFLGNREAQVIVASMVPDVTSQATLENVLLSASRLGAVSSEAWGLVAHDGANVIVREALVDGCIDVGLLALAQLEAGDARLLVEDVLVRDTRSAPRLRTGYCVGAAVRGGARAAVVARRLLCERSEEIGLYADGFDEEDRATLELEDVVVRGTRFGPTNKLGTGLWTLFGGQVRGRRVVLDDSEGRAVVVEPGDALTPTRLELTDLVVRRSHRVPGAATSGHGMLVYGGATAHVERGLWEANEGFTISTFDEPESRPSALDLVDATVRTLRCEAAPCDDPAISVAGRSRLTARRLTVTGGAPTGVFVSHTAALHGASFDVEDLLVSGMGWLPEGPGYGAVLIARGAHARLRRAVLADNVGVALWAGLGLREALGQLATLDVEDLVVLRTQPGPSGENGVAVALNESVRAELTRVYAHDNHLSAISIGSSLEGDRVEATLRDFTVTDTQPRYDGSRSGFGVEVYQGAEVLLERARLDRNASAAVAVAGGGSGPTRVTLRDVLVSNTQSDADALAGFGLVVQRSASTRVERGLFTNNREIGIIVRGDLDEPSASLVLEDVAVVDTRPARCSELAPEDEKSCSEGGRRLGGGHALGVDGNATLSADGFLLARSAHAGLAVGLDAAVELQRGSVTDNAVGVHLAEPLTDPGSLSDRVYVFDNGTDWVHTGISLPEPAEAIGRLRRPDLNPAPLP